MTLLSYGLNYMQTPNALENIEKRLDEGNKRFVRIELLIVGLYATMASIEVLARVI